MSQWEYYVCEGDAELAQLGQQGWELVAVLPDPHAGPPRLYFKRPAQSFRERVTEEQKQRYYAALGIAGGPAQ